MPPRPAESWYKNVLFYGLDVSTFQDSNGDGIGDFPGLCSRVDYIADLGVTCIWLLPFFPTRDGDNGYDVTDYFGVDPRLGTLQDFVAFVRKAGERGVRVIIDLVMDHTSDRHPWFQAARHDRRSRYRRYYIWTDAPPPVDPNQRNIFPGEESTVWTYDEVAGQYYFHQFYRFEPDLDVLQPEVQEEIKRVVDYWLSFGIAGFRVDAVSHMIDSPLKEERHPTLHDPHQILRDLRSYTSARRIDAALLGEADVVPEELGAFFGSEDELHLLYNFVLANYMFLALAIERAEPISRALRLMPPVPEAAQFVNFLRNLDELDLERLSDNERDLVFREFAPDPGMKIFDRGIRRRLAPMLATRPRLELALSLLYSMPGAPLLIYGDEIGMGDNLSLHGRHAVRTPMQWSSEPHAGFSTAPAESLTLPLIETGPFGYPRVNVADQTADPDSFLNWMKRLLQVRRQCPEWGAGRIHPFDTGEPSLFGHQAEWQGKRIIALHNLSDKTCSVRLNQEPDSALQCLLSSGADTSNHARTVRMASYGYGWYRVVPAPKTAGS
jgi:maltose alpha-D-glucosyltransferase/alpha-amylase